MLDIDLIFNEAQKTFEQKQDELLFVESTHSYYLNGKQIPSVTSILKPLYNFNHISRHILDAAAKLGSDVHKLCELDDQGLLEKIEGDFDSRVMPYLLAWRNFNFDHDVYWQLIEQKIFNKVLGYAGTLDRFGSVDGIPTILDIKTSKILSPTVGLQLAAYQKALPLDFYCARRLAVQLKNDGTYHIEEYNDPNDWPVFCSLLTLSNWSKVSGIIPNFNSL